MESTTRPEIITWKGKKYRVPKVLLGENHKKINSSAHGSNLLIENIQLMQEIIDWLNH